MTAVSDVQQVYGTLQGVWSKSRAHIVAHLVAAGVVFGLFGVTWPEFGLIRFDPAALAENRWFKLAQETGAVYLLAFVPLALLAVYIAVLSTVGRVGVTLIALMTRPRIARYFDGLTPKDLEPVALMLSKDDFDLGEILERSSVMILQFQSTKRELWKSYQDAIDSITRNNLQYLGDFLVFAVTWAGAFTFGAHTEWAMANRPRFWPVMLVLLGLSALSWVRVSRAIVAVPRMHLQFIALIVQTDPDFHKIMAEAPVRREKVRKRIGLLLNRAARGKGYVRIAVRRPLSKVEEGWPLVAAYDRGSDVAQREAGPRSHEPAKDLLSYLYYRAHRRLVQVAHGLAGLVRYVFIGV